MNIDYNTLNIILPLQTTEGEIQVHIPPVNEAEVKANALVLGRFIELLDSVNPVVLLSDYEIYVDDIIENIAGSKNFNEIEKNKFIKEKKNSLFAMLERNLIGSYFFDSELKGYEKLDDNGKDKLKAMLLVFIVLFRYIKPNVSKEEWLERMDALNISFTSLDAMEWKNTLKTQSLEEETLGL